MSVTPDPVTPVATTPPKSVIESLLSWATSPVEEAKEPSAPPTLPLVSEFDVLKLGPPWRGSYPRKLVIGEGKVVTVEPETGRETNCWESPRFVPKATRSDGGATIELNIALWSQAPEWTYARIRLGLDASQSEAVAAALVREGVLVE